MVSPGPGIPHWCPFHGTQIVYGCVIECPTCAVEAMGLDPLVGSVDVVEEMVDIDPYYGDDFGGDFDTYDGDEFGY